MLAALKTENGDKVVNVGEAPCGASPLAGL
jgi:hypothetical protein